MTVSNPRDPIIRKAGEQNKPKHEDAQIKTPNSIWQELTSQLWAVRHVELIRDKGHGRPAQYE